MVREAADVWERSPDRRWGWGVLGPSARSSSSRTLVAWVGLQRAWHSPWGHRALSLQRDNGRGSVCAYRGVSEGVESVRCI